MHAYGWDCPTAAVIYMLISPFHDITLMQILHGNGSIYFGNSDTTSHSIISRCGLESFVYTNCILIKLYCWKLEVPVIVNHRIVAKQLLSAMKPSALLYFSYVSYSHTEKDGAVAAVYVIKSHYQLTNNTHYKHCLLPVHNVRWRK